MRPQILLHFVFCSFLITITANAQLKYSDSELKDQIHQEASRNHQPLSYNQARVSLLGHMSVHQEQNQYFITDVYCETEYRSPGLGKIPNNSVINVEHTWPQSKFGGASKGIKKSDLHHLFPTDSQLNSIRGSNPFGEVIRPSQNTKCPQSQIGFDDDGHRVFEPPHDHKGNVARALFYFSVRYHQSISKDEEDVLRQWHEEDPVDTNELLRNDQIESFQGNRNPFIDQPDLVNMIKDF